jgi:hypothetical protein
MRDGDLRGSCVSARRIRDTPPGRSRSPTTPTRRSQRNSGKPTHHLRRNVGSLLHHARLAVGADDERRAAGQHRIMTADLPTERHDPSDRFAQTEGVVVPRGFTNVRLTVRHPPQQGLLPPPPGPRAGHRLQRPGRRAQRTPVPRSRLRRLLVHPRGPDPGPATSRRPRRHIRREPSRTRPPQPAGQLRRGTAPRGRTPGRGGFTRSH